MSYTLIWTNANDEAFQGRCWAGLWDVANRVIEGEATYPNTADDITFAKLILKDEVLVTDRQLTQQVLRNTTIAANPATSTDADIQFQLAQNVWDTLRGIG